MKCEQNYCIYNKHRKCILDETEINSLGMCDACILVYLEQDFLDAEKKRQLLGFEDE